MSKRRDGLFDVTLTDKTPAQDPLDAFIAQYEPPALFRNTLRIELGNVGIHDLDSLLKAPVMVVRQAVLAAASHDAQALLASAARFVAQGKE